MKFLLCHWVEAQKKWWLSLFVPPTFHSQDLNSNLPHCLPYSSHNVCSENFVLNQLIFLQWTVTFLYSCGLSAWYCKEKFCLGHSWELKDWSFPALFLHLLFLSWTIKLCALCKVPNKINRFKTLLFSMLLSIAMQGSLFRKHSLCSSKVNECLWYLKHAMSFEFIYLIIVMHFYN